MSVPYYTYKICLPLNSIQSVGNPLKFNYSINKSILIPTIPSDGQGSQTNSYGFELKVVLSLDWMQITVREYNVYSIPSEEEMDSFLSQVKLSISRELQTWLVDFSFQMRSIIT